MAHVILYPGARHSYSPAQIRLLAGARATGGLTEILPGIYVASTWADSPLGRAHALAIEAPSDLGITHRAAAWVWTGHGTPPQILGKPLFAPPDDFEYERVGPLRVATPTDTLVAVARDEDIATERYNQIALGLLQVGADLAEARQRIVTEPGRPGNVIARRRLTSTANVLQRTRRQSA